MPFYKIYAGMGGGFGGAYYHTTDEYDNEEQALEDAYQYACEVYEMQEGSGCESWDDFLNRAESEVDESDFDDIGEYNEALAKWAQEASNDARESWVDYYVEETDSLDDVDE